MNSADKLVLTTPKITQNPWFQSSDQFISYLNQGTIAKQFRLIPDLQESILMTQQP